MLYHRGRGSPLGDTLKKRKNSSAAIAQTAPAIIKFREEKIAVGPLIAEDLALG